MQPVDAHYSSWIYVPTEDDWVGGKPTLFERTRDVKHATRKAGKARALRLAKEASSRRSTND